MDYVLKGSLQWVLLDSSLFMGIMWFIYCHPETFLLLLILDRCQNSYIFILKFLSVYSPVVCHGTVHVSLFEGQKWKITPGGELKEEKEFHCQKMFWLFIILSKLWSSEFMIKMSTFIRCFSGASMAKTVVSKWFTSHWGHLDQWFQQLELFEDFHHYSKKSFCMFIVEHGMITSEINFKSTSVAKKVGRCTGDQNQEGSLSKPDVPEWLKGLVYQDLIMIFWVLFLTVDQSKYLRKGFLLSINGNESKIICLWSSFSCLLALCNSREAQFPTVPEENAGGLGLLGMCQWPSNRRDLSIRVTALKWHIEFLNITG